MGFLRDTLGLPPKARDLTTPHEGTLQTIYPQVQGFWAETFGGSSVYISPRLARLVWVANRCMQLNAQQIAAMPIEYHTKFANPGDFEPAWISSPDPVWFPNGISDAVFAIVENLYGWGFSVQQITRRYANGFPQSWTVLDSSRVTIDVQSGRRTYKVGDTFLDPIDCVQIDRNPGNRIHGTPALEAFASQAWGILAGGEAARDVLSGGTPQSILKPKRVLTEEQAQALKAQFVAATRASSGPTVLDPEVEYERIAFNPTELALLESQEFTIRSVAAAYGTPASLLNMAVTGGLTYQNPAMLGEQWWRFELRPTSKRLADAFTAQMLPRGSWVSLDASDTFAEITRENDDDDPQESQVSSASPTQQPGGGMAVIAGGLGT